MDDWKDISTVPKEENLEVAVIENDEIHSVSSPCRLTSRGWISVRTGRRIEIDPSHWRPWMDEEAIEEVETGVKSRFDL